MNDYLEPFVLFAPCFSSLCTKGQTGWTPTQCSSDPERCGRGGRQTWVKVKTNANASAKTEIFKRFGILSLKEVCVLSGGGHRQTWMLALSPLWCPFYCLSPNSSCSRSFPLRPFVIWTCCTYSNRLIDCDSCVSIWGLRVNQSLTVAPLECTKYNVCCVLV